MSSSINYYWRLAATGSSFAVFGLGGLALSMLVFPVIFAVGGRNRLSRARWLIHKSFAAFIRFMEVMGIMRLEVQGGERLRACRNTLVLANHPTLIDVVALISLMPTASCVVKQALWNNPLLGGVVRAAGYISNSEPVNIIDDCAQDLAAGHPLVIFPEGTRSRPGEPLHFLRGASYIALRSRLPVLPVLIQCTPTTLTKRERWYQIPSRRFCLRIQVLEPVQPLGWIEPAQEPSLSARHLTHALENFFTRELARHGFTQA